MVKWYKDTFTDEIHETKLSFCFYHKMGMNKKQVNLIIELLEKYLIEYPELGIEKICDFFSLDYAEEELCEYNYTHNDQGELYLEQEDNAIYFDEEKIIAFNQVKMSGMRLEGDSEIKQIEKFADRLYDCRKHIRRLGIPGNKVVEQLGEEDISIMLDHEINSSQIDPDFLDVLLIRGLEESMFFKRIVIHEIGHAIAMCYEVAQDSEVKRLFAKYQKGFEDIDEFIAECFMVSEFTTRVPLANSVKERIKICRKKFRKEV